MLRSRKVSDWPGPSIASVLMPRLAKSSPAKITLIFLGVVHAVEQHDRRPLTAPSAFDEICRQARTFVGHLHPLDVRMEPVHRRLIATQRLAIHHELLRR